MGKMITVIIAAAGKGTRLNGIPKAFVKLGGRHLIYYSLDTFCHRADEVIIVFPEKYVKRFAEAGAEMLTFHYEAAENPGEVIELIRRQGIKVGITINPDVPVAALRPYIDKVDMVLLMSVFAGYGGQKFIEESYDRLKELKDMVDELNPACMIQVDGGVSIHNAKKLFDHGANVLVAGSAVFNAPDPEEMIQSMLKV